MTTFTMNDAYTQWLGIAAAELPVHHYRLLGVALHESDTQAILAAYNARTSQVAAHLGGPDAQQARRLLGELAAAQACLLDPQAKSSYDEALRRQTAGQNQAGMLKRPAPRPGADALNSGSIAAATATVATATAASPPAARPSSSPQPLAGDAPAGPPDQREFHHSDPVQAPPSALPWLIGGVCAGLLGVCVLGLILLAIAQDRRPVAVDNNTDAADRADDAQGGNGASQDAAQKSEEHGRRDRRSGAGRDRIGDAHVERSARTSRIPQTLTWDREPDGGGKSLFNLDDLEETSREGDAVSVGPPVDAPSAPDVKTVLAALPRAFALPRRAADENAPVSGGAAVLTRVDVDHPRDVNIQLVSNDLPGGSGRFELSPRDDADAPDDRRVWDAQFTPAGGPAETVGQYTLADGELAFAWSPEADPAAAAQLQNQPLRITAGDQSTTIAQRVPAAVAPIVVKVDAGAVGTTAPIDDPPQNAELMVAMDELSDLFSEHAWAPSATFGVGEETDLRFGSSDDTFQLALRITAERTGGGRQVRVEARPMFRQGPRNKWDYFRPKEAARMLTSWKQQEQLLDAQVQQIRQKYRRDPVAQQQATDLHNRQAAVLLENIANLERINNLCQDIQDKGELHFHIYAESGGQRIDLAHTEDVDEPDGAAPPEDENVGPPTDPNVGAPVESKDGG